MKTGQVRCVYCNGAWFSIIGEEGHATLLCKNCGRTSPMTEAPVEEVNFSEKGESSSS